MPADTGISFLSSVTLAACHRYDLQQNSATWCSTPYCVHPYKIHENGEKEIYFPVEELGLPDTYKQPWGNKRHKIWVYKYDGEVIWGITSVLIRDVIERY